MVMSPSSSSNVRVAPSSVEGTGILATRDFASGDVVLETGDLREVTDDSPLPEGERLDHCDWLADGTVYLIPEPIRFTNHSCDPNSYKLYRDGRRYTIARRAIAAGEEITHDYSINGFGDGTWECGCGSKRCRGTIESNFFRLPMELKIEYLPLLTDVFREIFADEIARLESTAREGAR
jgi:hypothetical protein